MAGENLIYLPLLLQRMIGGTSNVAFDSEHTSHVEKTISLPADRYTGYDSGVHSESAINLIL